MEIFVPSQLKWQCALEHITWSDQIQIHFLRDKCGLTLNEIQTGISAAAASCNTKRIRSNFILKPPFIMNEKIFIRSTEGLFEPANTHTHGKGKVHCIYHFCLWYSVTQCLRSSVNAYVSPLCCVIALISSHAWHCKEYMLLVDKIYLLFVYMWDGFFCPFWYKGLLKWPVTKQQKA